MIRAFVLALLPVSGLAAAIPPPDADAVDLRILEAPENVGTVEVSGLPTGILARILAAEPEVFEWKSVLRLETAGEGPEDRPAIVGTWSVAEGVLRFRPRFPPRSGLGLRAVFDGPALAVLVDRTSTSLPRLEERMIVPAPATARHSPPARVVRVLPQLDRVPANLLRFYVTFTEPMARRRVDAHVRIVAESGDEVADAFVAIPEGLWDPTDRRLTLFLHPGRIKRGVGPNETLGPPLVEGRGYRLIIDRELRDAAGRPLAETFEHRFRVGPADRRSPDPASWDLESPRGRQGALSVRFPAPVDPPILRRALQVHDANGEPVAGRVDVTNDGLGWTFEPSEPWTPGAHRLVVAPFLEDPAGNRIGRLFDAELSGDAPPPPMEPPVLVFQPDS